MTKVEIAKAYLQDVKPANGAVYRRIERHVTGDIMSQAIVIQDPVRGETIIGQFHLAEHVDRWQKCKKLDLPQSRLETIAKKFCIPPRTRLRFYQSSRNSKAIFRKASQCAARSAR